MPQPSIKEQKYDHDEFTKIAGYILSVDTLQIDDNKY